MQYARARDAHASRHAHAGTKDTTQLARVVWGPELNDEESSAATVGVSAATDLVARIAACSAGRGTIDILVAEVVARGNRDAFARVATVVAGPRPPPSLLPTILLVSGGCAADNELVVPALVASLRKMCAAPSDEAVAML